MLLLSVISCRSMTYQQNKENKKHISDKVDRPKDSVSAVDGIKIKVSKNNSELCEAVGWTKIVKNY